MSNQSNPPPYIIRCIRKSRKHESFNQEDIQFLNWMTEVENHVYDKLEISIDELPDEPYRSSFEDGMKAQDMARIVLRNAFSY